MTDQIPRCFADGRGLPRIGRTEYAPYGLDGRAAFDQQIGGARAFGHQDRQIAIRTQCLQVELANVSGEMSLRRIDYGDEDLAARVRAPCPDFALSGRNQPRTTLRRVVRPRRSGRREVMRGVEGLNVDDPLPSGADGSDGSDAVHLEIHGTITIGNYVPLCLRGIRVDSICRARKQVDGGRASQAQVLGGQRVLQGGLRALEHQVDLQLITVRPREYLPKVIQREKQQSLGKRKIFLQETISLELRAVDGQQRFLVLQTNGPHALPTPEVDYSPGVRRARVEADAISRDLLVEQCRECRGCLDEESQAF